MDNVVIQIFKRDAYFKMSQMYLIQAQFGQCDSCYQLVCNEWVYTYQKRPMSLLLCFPCSNRFDYNYNDIINRIVLISLISDKYLSSDICKIILGIFLQIQRKI